MKKHKIKNFGYSIKLNKVIMMIIVLGLLVFAGCSSQMQTEKEYKIGATLPLTGAGANLGQPTLKGMELAVNEINAEGGINGKQLKIFAQDNKFDLTESANSVNFLLNTEDPDIFTSLFALPTNAISPILKENQKPLLYEAFSRTVVKDNEYAFKGNFDSISGCKKLTQYLKNNNKYEKLGVIFAQTDYNQECLQGIKEVEPDVEEYWYTFGDTDFKTIFTKAKEQGVDRLVTIAIDFEYNAMFKQLSEGDYGIKMAVATTSEISETTLGVVSDDVIEDTVSIDFMDINLKDSDFAKKYQETYNQDFSNYAAVGYEEVMIIAKAMESCEPSDSACLTESMKTVKDYNSIIGSAGFKDRVLQLTTDIYEYHNGWVRT